MKKSPIWFIRSWPTPCRRSPACSAATVSIWAACNPSCAGLLKTASEAQRWPDFGGDGDRFLGIRYGLTCWLDEIFIRDSPWHAEWNERKLEESLYGSNERTWKFWFQAKLSQARPGTDALEAYHLIVMLGFRGEGPEKPETIASWCAAAETQLARVQNQPWSGPQELQPELVVTPRRGRERMRTILMLLIGVAALRDSLRHVRTRLQVQVNAIRERRWASIG